MQKKEELRNIPKYKLRLILAIDLLIKKEHDKNLTKKFVEYLLNMSYNVKSFSNNQELQESKLKYFTEERLGEFKSLNKYGEYSVEFIATLFESITTEKTTRLTSVSMFKGVLEAIYKDKDVFSIVAQAKYNR